MLRKHFMMSGLEKPDYIITYYANLKVPFIGGEETKNLTMWETGTESEPLAEFKVISDTYINGYGKWAIKTSNPTAYYSLILDLYNNTYYADSGNPNSITGIFFPEGITEIGGLLLLDNSSLLDISLPNSLISIGTNTFNTCLKLTNITIPNNVININENAFKNCTSLVNFNAPLFPPSLSGYDIFGDFTELLHLKINVLLPLTYEHHADWNKYSTKLIHYHDPNSLYYRSSQSINSFNYVENDIFVEDVGEGLIYFSRPLTTIARDDIANRDKVSYIALPNTITHISDSALNVCELLETCILPDSLLFIGNYAFASCDRLKSINIPKNVTTIYNLAFNSCINMDTIVVDDANNVYDSRENCNAIIETASNTLIKGCHTTLIPNSIINIGPYSFYKCSKLTNIVIPEGVTNIENNAFLLSQSLENVNLPNSLLSIKSYAFSLCTNLSEIVIPKNMTSIQSNAFGSCTNLTSIIWNASRCLMSSYSAFYGCNNLTSLIFGNSVTLIPKYIIPSNNKGITSIIIPHSVEDIESGSLDGATSLQHVTIPASVSNIGQTAFHNRVRQFVIITSSIKNYCESLINSKIYKGGGLDALRTIQINNEEITEITIPESVIDIPEYTFYNCDSLKKFSAHSNITSIGDHAFDGNKYLAGSIILDRPKLGASAFYDCTSLTIECINVPATVPAYCFKNSGLKILKLADGNLKGIDSLGCYNCKELTEVYLPDSLTVMGSLCFSGCYIAKNNFVNKSKYTSFTGLKLADEEIDKVLFLNGVVKYSRPSNTHLSIYGNTTGIEWWAFPTNLETITVEDTNTKYDSRENCNAVIETLTNKLIAGCSNTIIPNTVLIIGKNAFRNNQKINEINLGNTITTIEDVAFADCVNITNLTIPDTVQTIGKEAFYNMTNLQEITLGSGLLSIGNEALRECRNLHTIRYNGTIEMWNLITKGTYWKTFAATNIIHCTDGNVEDLT